jgi:Uncharacterised protein family (UPF0236)
MGEHSEVLSAVLLGAVAEALDAGDASAGALAERIGARVSARVGGDVARSTAGAFVEGVVLLAKYASASLERTASVVDAETEAVAVSRRVVRPVLQARLQQQLDALDVDSAGQTCCAKCGGVAESQGRRARGWKGVLGHLALKRRYVWCETCEIGAAPAQQKLGLSDGEFTPRLEEVCTMLATTVPHGMAVTLAHKTCGIDVSIKAVEDMIERRGAEVQRRDREEAGKLGPYDPTGLPVPNQVRPTDAVAPSATPKVAYLETDGVVPITREEITGDELTELDREKQAQAKAEKARGGKARRFNIVGREVKNAVLYDGKDCATESPGRGCLLAKTYVSHLGDWGAFVALLWTQILRLRFDEVQLLVVLSDGAEWVRSLCKWLPIPVFLILDLFHVKHRIWEVANALYGERTPEAASWARVQCDRVERGRAKDVIETLRFTRSRRAKIKELVDRLRGYLTDNLDRMDYPAYRARGLRVGSGAVESANFHVTGARLKLQGMRWSAEGAGHMAALRADLFNGRWEARTRELMAA